MKSSRQTVRDTRFELLRIVGIYCVILTHASAFGIRNLIMPVAPAGMTFSVICNYLLNFPGTVFNLVFIIITGYFCSVSGVSYRRVFLLGLQLCVYAWVIGIIFYAFGLTSGGSDVLLKAVFPLFTGYNWFIVCYIVFSLFIPFINKAVRACTARELQQLIALLFILRCVSAVFKVTLYVTVARDMELFLLLYLIGAYFRLYADVVTSRYPGCKRWVLYALLISVVFSASVVIMCMLYRANGGSVFLNNVQFLLEPAKILCGACIFKAVEQMPKIHISCVNKLALLVPGIYMLHENPLIRPYLWEELFPVLPMLNTPLFVPAMLVKSAAVLACCIVLNMPWTYLIRPVLSRRLFGE